MSKALVFVGGLAAPGNEWPLTPIRRSAREQGWRTKYFNERLVFGPLTTSAQRLVELVDELDKDMLVPKSATRPNRPHTLLEVPNVGHLRVNFDQSTADTIIEWANALTDELVERHQNLDRDTRSGNGPNSAPTTS